MKVVRVFVRLELSLGGDGCHGDGVVDRFHGIADNGVQYVLTMTERRAPHVASSALEVVMTAAPSVSGAVELVASSNAGTDASFTRSRTTTTPAESITFMT
jgi:hypothetical protein